MTGDVTEDRDLAILVPTRLRPHAVAPMAEAFAATCTANTWLLFCIDGDDDPAYPNAIRHAQANTYPRILSSTGPRRRLVGTLNHYIGPLVDSRRPPSAIGYLGDDHRPETYAWDEYFLAELDCLGAGIVYGDDGLQHENLPTACAISTEIIAALGHMAPPALTHMYCDTYWRDLGRGAGCLSYLPEVRIVHRHPSKNLSRWDASYAESNSPGQYAADAATYHAYTEAGLLAADIATVQKLRNGA